MQSFCSASFNDTFSAEVVLGCTIEFIAWYVVITSVLCTLGSTRLLTSISCAVMFHSSLIVAYFPLVYMWYKSSVNLQQLDQLQRVNSAVRCMGYQLTFEEMESQIWSSKLSCKIGMALLFVWMFSSVCFKGTRSGGQSHKLRDVSHGYEAKARRTVYYHPQFVKVLLLYNPMMVELIYGFLTFTSIDSHYKYLVYMVVLSFVLALVGMNDLDWSLMCREQPPIIAFALYNRIERNISEYPSQFFFFPFTVFTDGSSRRYDELMEQRCGRRSCNGFGIVVSAFECLFNCILAMVMSIYAVLQQVCCCIHRDGRKEEPVYGRPRNSAPPRLTRPQQSMNLSNSDESVKLVQCGSQEHIDNQFELLEPVANFKGD